MRYSRTLVVIGDGQHVFKVVVIKHQIVKPKGGTLANRYHLGRLQMRVTKSRQRLILQRKIAQVLHYARQLAAHEQQRLL